MVEVVKTSYAKMEASVRGGVDRAVTAVRKRQAVWAARVADSVAGKSRTAGYENWEVREMLQTNIMCFLAGTLVLTANGAVPIEDIQPGMQVWSRHEVTGQAGFKPVVYRFETQSTSLLDVIYQTQDGEQHKLTTTPEHPFYIAQEDAWFAAADLVVGDQVMTATGETADVIRVAAKRGPPEGTPTYNLAIADHHTYFVTPEDTPEAKQWSTALWVHNTGRGKCNGDGGTFKNTEEFITLNDELLEPIRRGDGLRNIINIRKFFKVSKTRNIAYAEVNLTAISGNFKAVSGETNRKGFLPIPKYRLFKTKVVEDYYRAYDSEVILLENIAQKLSPDSFGTIRLFSERPICLSCGGVIDQFKSMFPNILITTSSGHRTVRKRN